MVTARSLFVLGNLRVPLRNFRICLRPGCDGYDRGSKGKRRSKSGLIRWLLTHHTQCYIIPAKQEASVDVEGSNRGNRTADGVPPAGAHFNPVNTVLGFLRSTVRTKIFSMVGFGLDLISCISGHHCTGFEPRSRMDATQKQPGSVLGPRPFPSDSPAGVCGMEHALTTRTLATMAQAGSSISIDWRRAELCCVVYVSGSTGH